MVSKIIDALNDELDASPLASRDPAKYETQNEIYIYRALQSAISVLGGRISKQPNYGPVPITKFAKSIFPSICR